MVRANWEAVATLEVGMSVTTGWRRGQPGRPQTGVAGDGKASASDGVVRPASGQLPVFTGQVIPWIEHRIKHEGVNRKDL